MNSTIFYRLLWKEFRQVRAFAICLLVIGVILQFILLAAASLQYQSSAVSLIAMLFPALFMVGSAATIFSMEHENKSFMLQRMLPVSARAVFFAKVLVTAAIAIAILLLLSALPQVVGVGYFQSVWVTPASLLLLSVEFLAWGTLFSLVDRHPLRSLLLAVGCPMLIAAVIFGLDLGTGDGPADRDYISPMAIAIRLTIITIVGWLAFQKSSTWFEEREFRWGLLLAIALFVGAIIALLLMFSLAQSGGRGVGMVRWIWISPVSLIQMPLELAAWTMLFRVCRQPMMRSLLMAIACLIISSIALPFVSVCGFEILLHNVRDEQPLIVVSRLILLAALIAVTVRNAGIQSTSHIASLTAGIGLPFATRQRTLETSAASIGPISDWWRLVWLQFRSTGWAVSILTLLFGGWILLSNRSVIHYTSVSGFIGMLVVCGSSLAVVAAIIGALTWQATGQRTKFLAGLGLESRKIWASQLLIGLSVCGQCLTLCTIILRRRLTGVGDESYSWALTVDQFVHGSGGMTWLIVMIPLAAFSWSQLVSHHLKSTMMSLVVGTLTGVIAAGVPLLCWHASIPLWLVGIPWGLLPLAITFCNSKTWMLSLPRSRAVTGTLVAGVLLVFGLMAGYRAYEFPPVDEQFVASVLHADTPVSAEQTALFLEQRTAATEAFDMSMRKRDPEKVARAEIVQREVARRILEQPKVDLDAVDVEVGHKYFQNLQGYLLEWQTASSVEKSEADYAERLIRYRISNPPHWGMNQDGFWRSVVAWQNLPDVDATRVSRLANHVLDEAEIADEIDDSQRARLRMLWSCFDPAESSRHAAYFRLQPTSIPKSEKKALILQDRLFPWEGIRERRWLAQVMFIESQLRQHTLRCVANNTPADKALQISDSLDVDYRLRYDHNEIIRDAISNLEGLYSSEDYVLGQYSQLAERRARALWLAIFAWQKDHDTAAPQTLAELVPQYLDEVPIDPMTAQPFHWFPSGIDLENVPRPTSYHRDSRGNPIEDRVLVTIGNELVENERKRQGEPFLWSPNRTWQLILPGGGVSRTNPTPFRTGMKTDELTIFHLNHGHRYWLVEQDVDAEDED